MNHTPIPAATLRALNEYRNLGRLSSHFLTAVLTNDLKGAFMLADSCNKAALESIVNYVYWDMPSLAQGSRERVDAWIAGRTQELTEQRVLANAIDAANNPFSTVTQE